MGGWLYRKLPRYIGIYGESLQGPTSVLNYRAADNIIEKVFCSRGMNGGGVL